MTISLIALFLDRLSKWFILNNPDFTYSFIELHKNDKFYSISLDPIILNAIIFIILVILLIILFKLERNKLGFYLVFFGGLSNFFDRIMFGYVIDWINVSFSAFNIADLMIIIGIIIIGFSTVKSSKI